MKLYIAGIYHFDPLGRHDLRKWLAHCASVNNGPPAFIATEWDKNLFSMVKADRSRFRDLAKGEWPNASPELLLTLELSLGYETDSHTDLFPTAEILWLDEGRTADVSNYAPQRFVMYKDFLGRAAFPINSQEALRKLSKAARQRADTSPSLQENSYMRDSKFASLLQRRIEKGGGDWAIAIVGARHASPNPNSMRWLLEEHRLLCDVSLL